MKDKTVVAEGLAAYTIERRFGWERHRPDGALPWDAVRTMWARVVLGEMDELNGEVVAFAPACVDGTERWPLLIAAVPTVHIVKEVSSEDLISLCDQPRQERTVRWPAFPAQEQTGEPNGLPRCHVPQFPVRLVDPIAYFIRALGPGKVRSHIVQQFPDRMDLVAAIASSAAQCRHIIRQSLDGVTLKFEQGWLRREDSFRLFQTLVV